jgi:hypothetical protein
MEQEDYIDVLTIGVKSLSLVRIKEIASIYSVG